MSSDNPVAKRNALVIPGGLVLFYCVLAILYAEWIRSDATLCNDGGQVLIRNVCYNVWKLLLPLVLISLGVLLGGLLGFRTHRDGMTGDLYHGTGAHFMLALLASFVAVPLLSLLIQYARERSIGTVFVIQAYGVPFEHLFLLGLATATGSLMFFPFLGLYLHQNHRRQRFLEFADLPRAEPVRAQAEEDDEKMWAPLEDEWDAHDAWEGERPWPKDRPAGAPDPATASAAPVRPRDVQAPSDDNTWTPLPEPAGDRPHEARDDDAMMQGATLAAALPGPEQPPHDDLEAAIDRLPEPRLPPEPTPPAPPAPPIPVPYPSATPSGPDSFTDYPGISRAVTELPGVDAAAGKLLERAGIKTTARLRYVSEETVSREAGVPLDRVRQWRASAELMGVPGIGPAYARALVAAGIRGLDDLTAIPAATVLARVKNAPGVAFTEKRVEGWQDAARGMTKQEQPVPES